jgi:hypothetical protein
VNGWSGAVAAVVAGADAGQVSALAQVTVFGLLLEHDPKAAMAPAASRP